MFNYLGTHPIGAPTIPPDQKTSQATTGILPPTAPTTPSTTSTTTPSA